MSPQESKVEDIPDSEPWNGQTTSILDEVVSGSDMDIEELKGWEWGTEKGVALREARKGE